MRTRFRSNLAVTPDRRLCHRRLAGVHARDPYLDPARVSGLQWTVDAYTLVLASLLMPAGSTADRLGRRRVFEAGLALFSLGSRRCALAPTLELLVARRVVHAIGGARLSPAAMSIVRNVFEDPRERAQAIGVFAAMFSISIARPPLGPAPATAPRLGLAVAALGYLTATGRARDTARRTAERLEEPDLRDLEPPERAVAGPRRAPRGRGATPQTSEPIREA